MPRRGPIYVGHSHQRRRPDALARAGGGNTESCCARLANFERYYESIAHPFEWKFTRADLNALIARMRYRCA